MIQSEIMQKSCMTTVFSVVPGVTPLKVGLDARADFGWMRARARAACRQPARLLISLARWLLNARPVAKTDALIVFLSEFWV